VAHIEKKRNAYRALVQTREGKGHFRRTKGKTGLQEIEWDDANWIHLAQDKYNGGLLRTC
jgi:hypothetical protein